MFGRLAAALAITAVVAAACAPAGPTSGKSDLPADPNSYDESPSSVVGQAAILDATGVPIGIAHLRETRLGVRVEVKVTKLPPGPHGTHVHAVGKCEPPEFTTAGAHFNINAKAHGVPGSIGAHAGDMPDLIVGADGTGSLLFYSPHLSLQKAASNGLTFGQGTAIVIHANEDDHKTDPSGNSGARIACGVVKLAF